jgi:hypothetical protein
LSLFSIIGLIFSNPSILLNSAATSGKIARVKIAPSAFSIQESLSILFNNSVNPSIAFNLCKIILF